MQNNIFGKRSTTSEPEMCQDKGWKGLMESMRVKW